MAAGLVYLLVAVAVMVAAAVCYAVFARRLRSGAVSHGQAAAVSLLTLLITPGGAAILGLALARVWYPAVYASSLYFYGGYALGLVCFIVLNRRFRRLTR